MIIDIYNYPLIRSHQNKAGGLADMMFAPRRTQPWGWEPKVSCCDMWDAARDGCRCRQDCVQEGMWQGHLPNICLFEARHGG